LSDPILIVGLFLDARLSPARPSSKLALHWQFCPLLPHGGRQRIN
jgi:hypothetical protein